MIPPTIDPETPSPGERLVFERLAADQAHPDWIVLHSQDIARHRSQMESEIDFLIIAPDLGVLVLEVKGARGLDRKDGLWYWGRDTKGKARSPFKQASVAMHSVRDRVVKRHGYLKNILFWSAACFPFIEFADQSEEWAPWQVIDKTKFDQRPIGECIESVLEQARSRAAELGMPWFWAAAAAAEPTPRQCDEIKQMLRPDYEIPESPKARSKRIDAEVLRYTELQFDALDAMRRMPRVVFDGPAGTGKTLLALEAARRGHAAGRRVLLLCFNRPLAEWLREQAAGVADAKTISDHMVGAAGIPAGSPKLSGGGEFWDVELPQMACDGLIERPDPYDELVVDEAQDVLRSQFLDVLDLSLDGGLREGRWRLLGDFVHQAIYDDSVDLDGFCCDQGGGCAVFELDENCRNSPAVAALACAGGGIGGGYVSVMRTDDGDLPEVRYWEGVAQQQEMLCAALEDLRAAGFRGPKVAVLSTRNDAACVASTLTEQPWRDLLTPLTHSGPHGPIVDLHSGKTRYATVHRFKGLESRAVVLTDIERLSTPRERDLFYVGATRATQRLIVLAHESLRQATSGPSRCRWG